MKYVLDTSVAICGVIPRPLTPKAVRLREGGEPPYRETICHGYTATARESRGVSRGRPGEVPRAVGRFQRGRTADRRRRSGPRRTRHPPPGHGREPRAGSTRIHRYRRELRHRAGDRLMLSFPYQDEPLSGPPPPSLPSGSTVRWRPLVPVRVFGPGGRSRLFARAVFDPS